MHEIYKIEYSKGSYANMWDFSIFLSYLVVSMDVIWPFCSWTMLPGTSP